MQPTRRMMLVGKANLVLYVFGFPGKADLLQTLGKHKGGLQPAVGE
jgi:hypothetical protein